MPEINNNQEIKHPKHHSMAMETLNILDESKDQISDKLYLDLCNSLTKMNTLEKKKFYTVKYFFCKPEHDEDDCYDLDIFQKSEILQIPDDIYNDYTKKGYTHNIENMINRHMEMTKIQICNHNMHFTTKCAIISVILIES
jgi:poly(3-hydroxyalkanoate) synthetase